MIGQGKKYGHGTWPFISAHKIGITIFIRMATYQPLYKGGLFTELFSHWLHPKGWSPKFATGLNIIIGIVQKV